MANNIVLKTYKGGSVTPLDDGIVLRGHAAALVGFQNDVISHCRSS